MQKFLGILLYSVVYLLYIFIRNKKIKEYERTN